MSRPTSRLLIDESPLQVLPSLAVKIGLSEAIVMQQLHYWLRDEKNGVEHGGYRWIHNTYEEWSSKFPFWHAETIRKIFAGLRQSGLIVTARLAGGFDRTNYYRIDYRKFGQVDAENPTASEPEKCTASDAENPTASNRTEKTSKKTTKKRGLPKKAHDQKYSPAEELLPPCIPLQAWLRWCVFRVEKGCKVTPTTAAEHIKFLVECSAKGMTAEKVIQQSINSSWQGLFELKPALAGGKPVMAPSAETRTSLKSVGLE